MDDLDDLSFEEDFSETPVFAEEEPQMPQQKEVKRNNAFEILSMEKIVENVLEMSEKVQNFLGVSVHCAMEFFDSLINTKEKKFPKNYVRIKVAAVKRSATNDIRIR